MITILVLFLLDTILVLNIIFSRREAKLTIFLLWTSFIALLLNAGQFKGSRLSDVTGKKGTGILIPGWYNNKEYEKIIDYIKNETEEFIKFNKWLYKKKMLTL